MKNYLKHFICLCLLLFLNETKAQQDTLRFRSYKAYADYVTLNYKLKYPELEFFKYKIIGTPLNPYDSHRGDTLDSICSGLNYLSLINELDISSFNSHPKINSEYVLSKMIEGVKNKVLPLSIALVKYADLKDSAIYLNTVGWDGHRLLEQSPAGFYPFKQEILFASSALNEAIETNEVTFVFNEDLFLSNVAWGDVNFLQADYADGGGYRDLIPGNTSTIVYDTPGEKIIRLKMGLEGKVCFSAFKITIMDQFGAEKIYEQHSVSGCSTPPQLPTGGPYSISTTKLGTYVSGEYAVWHSTCNTSGLIRKPYIISAGFNPGNGKQLVSNGLPNFLNFVVNNVTISLPDGGWNGDWRGLYYETYNGGYNKRFSPVESGQCNEGSDNGDRYLDRLRDEGYDIIILKYDNGTDYAINNAALVIELIEQINQQKFANGYYFENVVSGYSAGGIATKLALSLMESRYKQGLGPHPHTRMWVSVETENQGANVPLGLQHFFAFQKETAHVLPSLPLYLNWLKVSVDWINLIVANLSYDYNNNPGANELTRYMASSGNGQHPDRTNLLNTFASIPYNTSNGYPEFCRRVGVSQGSGLGYTIPHAQPEILNTRLKSGLDALTASSWPSDCGGTYDWHLMRAEKVMKARWWSSINGNNLFDGRVVSDGTTIFPMLCVRNIFTGWSCSCIGPYSTSDYTVYGDLHEGAPDPGNVDDAPASTLAAHIEMYTQSAYPFYNNWFLGITGDAFAYHDDQLHGFAPTVSTLDLHDPTTGAPLNNFQSPASLNLFTIGPVGTEPDKRYGFPYFNNPTNHYAITPYDAVFAIGNNNGTYSDGVTPKPRNQLHVEDPQSMMGDYLSRTEVAPENLFLSNQTIGQTANAYSGYIGGYTAEFESRNKIIAGKTTNAGANIYSLYGNNNYLTPNGDVIIPSNAKAILHSGDQVELLPGVSIDPGAELAAYIQDYNCANNLFRESHAGKAKASAVGTGISENDPGITSKNVSSNKNGLIVYPNPNNGTFELTNLTEESKSDLVIADLAGKVMVRTEIANGRSIPFELKELGNGIYLLTVINEKSSRHFKLIISK
ncbi:MAG: T9SS type A sorting domain-containing protein [Bacteroidia bacterium]